MTPSKLHRPTFTASPKMPAPKITPHPSKNAPKNNYTNTTPNQHNIKNETIYTTTPEHQKSIQFGTLQKSSYNIKKRHFLCFFWFSERRKPEAKSPKAPNPSLLSTIFLTESFYSFSPAFSVGRRRGSNQKEWWEIVIVYYRALYVKKQNGV